MFTDKVVLEGNVYGDGTLAAVVNGETVESKILAAKDAFSFELTVVQGRNDVNLLFTDKDGKVTRKTFNFVYLTNYDYVVDASYTGTDGEAVNGIPTYKTVQAAVDAVPSNNADSKVILVMAGSYEERLEVRNPYITLIGEDRENTLIHYYPGVLGYGYSHVYNCIMDSQELLNVRLSIKNEDIAKKIVSNGAASTCGAQVLLENCFISGIQNALNSGNGSSPSGYINAINSVYYMDGIKTELAPKCNSTDDTRVLITDEEEFKSNLPYSDYVLYDATELNGIVKYYAGAGKLDLTVLQWEKTSYNAEWQDPELKEEPIVGDNINKDEEDNTGSDDNTGNGNQPEETPSVTVNPEEDTELDWNEIQNITSDKVVEAEKKRQLSIGGSGSFGVPVNLHVSLGKERAGKYANLYRYNAATGQAMFAVSAGGDYLVTVTDAKVRETVIFADGGYVVQPGDNLCKIARRYNTTLADIIRKNPQLTNPDLIRPGEVINIK